MNYLLDKNIQTQVHYIPIHLQPYYQQTYMSKFDLPNSEIFYNRCLSLPLFPEMNEKQVSYIVDTLEEGIEFLSV